MADGKKQKDAQKEAGLSDARVEAGLIEEDFEYQPREDVPEGIDLDAQAEALDLERRSGSQNPTGVVLPETLQNPYVSQEEQGMEMTPKTFGPPQYGSPDPATASSRLLTLEDGHPLDMVDEDHPAAISGDYAADSLGQNIGPTGAATDIQRHAAGDFSVEQNADANATEAAVELANENGVNLSEVEGSGDDGRITKPDVEAFLAERDGDEQ